MQLLILGVVEVYRNENLNLKIKQPVSFYDLRILECDHTRSHVSSSAALSHSIGFQLLSSVNTKHKPYD